MVPNHHDAGLSSSAALECATALALRHLFSLAVRTPVPSRSRKVCR
ncbi:hypothetical protein [Parafrankia sp. EUN1f]